MPHEIPPVGPERDAALIEALWNLRRVEYSEIVSTFPHYLHGKEPGKQTIWVDDKGVMWHCTACGLPTLSDSPEGCAKVKARMRELGWIYQIDARNAVYADFLKGGTPDCPECYVGSAKAETEEDAVSAAAIEAIWAEKSTKEGVSPCDAES